MSAVVCTDTELKCTHFPATPHYFNLKLLTKLEKGNNNKYTFSEKITVNYTKSAKIALILNFTLTEAFVSHSRVI